MFAPEQQRLEHDQPAKHEDGYGFPIAADLPEIDVRLLRHARLDADPAQRWLPDTIRAVVH
jgi:hypothetical protein